jgi:uncharacterized protein YoxC
MKTGLKHALQFRVRELEREVEGLEGRNTLLLAQIRYLMKDQEAKSKLLDEYNQDLQEWEDFKTTHHEIYRKLQNENQILV